MSHKLIRFTQGLYSRPHLISQAGFEAVSHYLTKRNLMDLEPAGSEPDEDPDDLDDFDPDSGVGVINVQGGLTYRPYPDACGVAGCSYTSILEDAEELLESGATTIILNVDSGGGEGYAAFETANELRKMCDEAGARLYAYNDGCMASAAYALGCVADEVISNPDAETGSIGVLVALANNSEQLKKMGIVRSFITAGANKIPFDEDGGWREGFLKDIQTKVDILYDNFAGHVSQYTGLSIEDVKATEAKMFMAKDALSLGLINSIMTRSEFVSYIVSKTQGVQDA
jgi:ClpP class serine protease